MNINDIKKAIANKNWSHEDYVLHTFVGGSEHRKIGFSFGKGTWYWFTYWSEGSTYAMFDQRYSQNNGTTQRGWSAEKIAIRMVQKAIKTNTKGA